MGTGRVRLFLDSNVLTGGIVAAWGLDKAVLSLCAARVYRLILAEAVRDEVEENLLLHLTDLDKRGTDRVLTHNSKHFTQSVAVRCSPRIATPADFFRSMARSLHV